MRSRCSFPEVNPQHMLHNLLLEIPNEYIMP
jgi:hypothetical protein